MNKVMSHGVCTAVGAVVGAALILLLSFLPSGSALLTAPVVDRPVTGSETLAWLASTIDRGDPDAPGRISRVSDALKSGELSADEVDGIPILASIVPAWWLARPDVYQITVIVLGRPDRRYSLALVKASGQQAPLQVHAEGTRVYPLADGVWRHHYQAYVYANGSHVDDGEVIKSAGLGISTISTQELDSRWQLAEESMGRWKLVCGMSTIPMVAAHQPK